MTDPPGPKSLPYLVILPYFYLHWLGSVPPSVLASVTLCLIWRELYLPHVAIRIPLPWSSPSRRSDSYCYSSPGSNPDLCYNMYLWTISCRRILWLMVLSWMCVALSMSLLGSDVSSLPPARVCLQRCAPYTSSVHNYPLPAENQALELFPKCLSDSFSRAIRAAYYVKSGNIISLQIYPHTVNCNTELKVSLW